MRIVSALKLYRNYDIEDLIVYTLEERIKEGYKNRATESKEYEIAKLFAADDTSLRNPTNILKSKETFELFEKSKIAQLLSGRGLIELKKIRESLENMQVNENVPVVQRSHASRVETGRKAKETDDTPRR